MIDECKILLSISCRSDAALIEPLSEKLEKEEWCELHRVSLVPGNYERSYLRSDTCLSMSEVDLVIIIGDRIEQMALCQCAFLRNIPIVHYGSGITNTIATFDDVNRHSMCLQADICLVEAFNAYCTTRRLHDAIGKTGAIIKTVGNLYLENLDVIDESLVPDEPYDLILMNAITKDEDTHNKTLNELYEAWIHIERTTIWIGGNPDTDLNINTKNYHPNFTTFYNNLPRPQFLGLLKRCKRYITNSSNIYYECTPLGLKPEQIVMIGERNRGRSSPMTWDQDYKTSDRICEVLKEYWRNKQC